MVIAVLYSRIVLCQLRHMYTHHRFEFYTHAKRMIALYLATMLSCASVFFAFAVGTYGAVCLAAAGSFFPDWDKAAYYDPDSPDPGMCSYVATQAQDAFTGAAYPTILLVFDLFLLIPVLTFLLFDNPHDCFVCLGKDPERIYSIYQLKKQERKERKMYARYSTRPDKDETTRNSERSIH